MPEPIVLEVPQWQGSPSTTARRLPAGAGALARSNPAARALYARAGFGYAYSCHYRLRGVSHGGSVTGVPGSRVTVR
ncbi:hypothetical protein ABZ820_19475 [Streptomyces diacarni]|uniref:hypothetical protein n=1 Tax=Streptomyces diacarni TaxID=2800381 RepID=UPI000DE90C76|nr:hypothetical protein [Streptomyces diacarni]